MNPIRWAAALTALVALAAGIISYSALAALARAVGVDVTLSWLYPLVVDGVLGVGTVAALVLRMAPLRTRAYVWTLITAAIAVSVAGNALHAERGLVLPAVAAAGASAVPAASLAAALHLLVIIVRASAVGGAAVESPKHESTAAVPRAVSSTSRRASKAERTRRLVQRAPDVSSGEAARRLGVSRSHAARLLREARTPRVLEGQR